VISNALYSVVNMTKRTPKLSPILCILAMVIVSIMFLVSGVGTLITDAFVWNAPKQLAISFAAFSGGALYISSLSKLRTYIFEAQLRKKSQQRTKISSASQTPTKAEKNQKAEEISQMDESSHMVNNPISQKQSRFNTEWRELSMSNNVSSKEVRLASPSSKTLPEWKISSQKHTKTEHSVSNLGTKAKTVHLQKDQHNSHQGRIRREEQTEGQILTKLWYLIVVASVVIPILVVLFIIVFFDQLETTKKVSEVHRESVEEYTVQVDVGFLVAMICNTYFLQYAASN